MSLNQSSTASASTDTFLTALVFNGAVFAVQIVAFTLLRPYFRRIYEPRSIRKLVGPLSFFWPIGVLKSDYRAILKANGPDAYFFVRFLRMMTRIFLPIWILSWAVLMPLTSIGTNVGTNKGLDRFVFGNVEPDKRDRYAAHIILVYLFTGWIFWNIKGEMKHFIITRQHYLIDPIHSKSVQANTVLVTGIPAKYLTQTELTKLYGQMPGGVKRIWINRNLKGLPDIYARRLKAANRLESAITKLLKTSEAARIKAAKSGKKDETPSIENVPRPTHKLGFLGLFGEKVDTIDWAKEEIKVCNKLLDEGKAVVHQEDLADHREKVAAQASGELGPEHVKEEGEEPDRFGSRDQQDAANPVPEEPSQHHDASEGGVPLSHSRSRTKTALNQMQTGIQTAGKQAIHATTAAAQKTAAQTKYAAQQAASQTKQLASQVLHRRGESQYPPLNSAFITFNRQIAAHLAYAGLAHHEPYRMSSRFVDVAPQDIIWGNLGLNPYETKVRFAISWGITLGLIILWAIPVAFVGTISNIQNVCHTMKWLNWLCDLPGEVIGIISGILPPVLLAVLMMLLPIVLRLLAQFEGIPKKTGCELSLTNRYFIFQVIHGFLIVTLSSGIIPALQQFAQNLTGIPNTLATELPKASTFFLTFVLLQLAGTAGAFLQIVTLIIYYVKLVILGSTPRSIWNLKYGPRNIGAWGTLWPNTTLIVVIGLAYSIISPVINGLICALFFIFFQLYKYLFLWVLDQSGTTDTGGLFFPKAISHIFVGLYVQQICLAALFFLAKTPAEGALMIVLIFLTVGYQTVLNNSYGPLLHALPLTLADKMYVAPDIPAHSDGETQDEDPEKHHELPQKSAPITEDEYGFANPAVAYPQRTVWIPEDAHGFSREAERSGRADGIDMVAGEGAVINDKGKVEVSEEPGVPGQVDQ